MLLKPERRYNGVRSKIKRGSYDAWKKKIKMNLTKR